MNVILTKVIPIIEKFAPFLAKALMIESPALGIALNALLNVFGSPISHDDLEETIKNCPNVEEKLKEAENLYKTHLSSADIDIKLNFSEDKPS